MITRPTPDAYPDPVDLAHQWLLFMANNMPAATPDDLAAFDKALLAVVHDPVLHRQLLQWWASFLASKLAEGTCSCCGEKIGSGAAALAFMDASGRPGSIEDAIPHVATRLLLQAVIAEVNGDDPAPFIDMIPLDVPSGPRDGAIAANQVAFIVMGAARPAHPAHRHPIGGGSD